MKYLSARLLTAFLALWAASTGFARADYLGWTYTSSPSVPGISVTSGTDSASLTLTDYTNHASGLTIPVAAYLTATNASSPVNFDGHSYNLTLTFKDTTTGDVSTPITFTGSLSGSLTATTSTLSNGFFTTGNSVTLDGHTYTVSIPAVTLANPTLGQQNIMANVTVSGSGTGGNPGGGGPAGGSGTPEPASLLLAGMGFSLLGARQWWKRR